ncbi:MAG: hypothetical protein ACREHV_06420 [Rhizomicrobium sp.]
MSEEKQDTVASLAEELATERLSNDIAFCQEGGVKYDDLTLDMFLPEAMEFVLRCRSAKP